MTYTLRFLPEIEEDVINGYVWYETKSRGLGEDFLRIFYACANELLWNPLLYPKVYEDFRRRLLRRFPYAIYFTIEKDQITVFGLFHCVRNPQTVNETLYAWTRNQRSVEPHLTNCTAKPRADLS